MAGRYQTTGRPLQGTCAAAAAVVGILLLVPTASGQTACTASTHPNWGPTVNCSAGYTALPTEAQWESADADVNAIVRLELGDQGITSVPENGFVACPYVRAKMLYLLRNRITTVGARAFSHLDALTVLNLGDNAITWVAPAALDGVSRLEELYLHNNRLGAFDFGALASLPEIAFLWLSGQADGGLGCGDHGGQWGHVDADRSGIANAVALCGAGGNPCPRGALACTLPPGDACTSDGRSVRCPGGYTAVPTEVQWGTHDASQVKDALFLRGPGCDNTGPTCEGNVIGAIPDDAFGACPYTGANSIWLQYNNIATVGSRAFSSLTSVVHIKLSHNLITYVDPLAFAGLTSLRQLELGNNIITALDRGIFAGLDALAVLHLMANGIALPTFDFVTFAPCPQLRIVYMTRNRCAASGADCSVACDGNARWMSRTEVEGVIEACGIETTTAAATTAPSTDWWELVSGGQWCTVDDVCASDGPGEYGDGESCTFVAVQAMLVTATAFETEDGYDAVRVGGEVYSGSIGPTRVLMQPGDNMTWSSDGSNTGDGFVICAEPVGTSTITTGASTATVPACDGVSTFRPSASSSGPCQPVSPPCAAGSAESVTASPVSDRVCEPCDGVSSFQALPGQTECEQVSATCALGYFETAAPTATSDRACQEDQAPSSAANTTSAPVSVGGAIDGGLAAGLAVLGAVLVGAALAVLVQRRRRTAGGGGVDDGQLARFGAREDGLRHETISEASTALMELRATGRTVAETSFSGGGGYLHIGGAASGSASSARPGWIVECSREEAETRLGGCTDGAFLLRPSERASSGYTLAYVVDGAVRHVGVATGANGLYLPVPSGGGKSRAPEASDHAPSLGALVARMVASPLAPVPIVLVLPAQPGSGQYYDADPAPEAGGPRYEEPTLGGEPYYEEPLSGGAPRYEEPLSGGASRGESLASGVHYEVPLEQSMATAVLDGDGYVVGVSGGDLADRDYASVPPDMLGAVAAAPGQTDVHGAAAGGVDLTGGGDYVSYAEVTEASAV